MTGYSSLKSTGFTLNGPPVSLAAGSFTFSPQSHRSDPCCPAGDLGEVSGGSLECGALLKLLGLLTHSFSSSFFFLAVRWDDTCILLTPPVEQARNRSGSSSSRREHARALQL